jgi:hypothetical protein
MTTPSPSHATAAAWAALVPGSAYITRAADLAAILDDAGVASADDLGFALAAPGAREFVDAAVACLKLAGAGRLLAAAAAGGGAPRDADPAELLRAFIPDPLNEAQKRAVRYHRAFEGTRAALRGGFFSQRDAPRLCAQLRSVLSSETRARFSLASGFILDGPVGSASGQAGTSLLFALRGARVLCAKVGPRTAVRCEWAAMEAVHGGGAHAPAVVRAEACEDVRPGDRGLAALLLPLLPLSVADAHNALPPGPGHARDALAASVALCGLAAVASFARAGWAHGDIKPANIMLAGGASAACVLIDLGTARAVGEEFSESSVYSLNEPRVASAAYDLVCLGATLAALQYGLFADDGTTRGSLLALVRAATGGARPPAALAAEACLALGARAAVGDAELRALAEEVAVAAEAAGLGAPPLRSVWPT